MKIKEPGEPKTESGEPKEIERKFKIKNLPPDLIDYPFVEILQGYISINENSREERVRSKGDKFFHTIKEGEGMVRTEKETEITKEQFDALWPKTAGKRIKKTRYKISHGQEIIELDIYHDNLDGLMSAEVEFSSEEAANKFIAPDWFGDDVTDDKRYKNKNLAVKGVPH